MTGILGFNAFHADSAACLVVDGRLVGAVAEERLGERQKHSAGFCDWAWLYAAGATYSCCLQSVAGGLSCRFVQATALALLLERLV